MSVQEQNLIAICDSEAFHEDLVLEISVQASGFMDPMSLTWMHILLSTYEIHNRRQYAAMVELPFMWRLHLG